MQSTQCLYCKHYHGFTECDAFPDIPDEIITGEFDHARPYPGDNGIRFELDDSENSTE